MQRPNQILISAPVRGLAGQLRSESDCDKLSLPSSRKEVANEATSQGTEPAVEPSVAERPDDGDSPCC
jgi:hypothetical protein